MISQSLTFRRSLKFTVISVLTTVDSERLYARSGSLCALRYLVIDELKLPELVSVTVLANDWFFTHSCIPSLAAWKRVDAVCIVTLPLRVETFIKLIQHPGPS